MDLMITGAARNSEIKLWSTDTWCCLQTVTFVPPCQPEVGDSAAGVMVCNHASLDASGSFLFLANLALGSLYVLHLRPPQILKNSSIDSSMCYFDHLREFD